MKAKPDEGEGAARHRRVASRPQGGSGQARRNDRRHRRGDEHARRLHVALRRTAMFRKTIDPQQLANISRRSILGTSLGLGALAAAELLGGFKAIAATAGRRAPAARPRHRRSGQGQARHGSVSGARQAGDRYPHEGSRFPSGYVRLQARADQIPRHRDPAVSEGHGEDFVDVQRPIDVPGAGAHRALQAIRRSAAAGSPTCSAMWARLRMT